MILFLKPVAWFKRLVPGIANNCIYDCLSWGLSTPSSEVSSADVDVTVDLLVLFCLSLNLFIKFLVILENLLDFTLSSDATWVSDNCFSNISVNTLISSSLSFSSSDIKSSNLSNFWSSVNKFNLCLDITFFDFLITLSGKLSVWRNKPSSLIEPNSSVYLSPIAVVNLPTFVSLAFSLIFCNLTMLGSIYFSLTTVPFSLANPMISSTFSTNGSINCSLAFFK